MTDLEHALGYKFKDKSLLRRALTLKGADEHFNNESLECLGDSLIGFVAAEKFFAEGLDEGGITSRKKCVVNDRALTQISLSLGLDRALIKPKGQFNNKKAIPSAYEAITAAIYLDGGMECVRPVLKRYLMVCPTENYKTLLQEYVQEREKRTPVYFTEERGEGYRSTVTALGERAEGSGESKKSAETAAAQKLYQILTARDSIEF